MSIIDSIKNHISNNRGKYGTVAGGGGVIGLQYASDNAPNTINKAAFNAMAKGQNLALDTADKIGYGKEQLQNLGLQNQIRPEDIQAGNEVYDSNLGKFINPSPSDILNAAEHSSKTFNDVQEAKAQAQNVVQQAKAQVGDTINQGIEYVKGLNPFNENTINIPIKSMLLEGCSALDITGVIMENVGPWDRHKLAQIQYLNNMDNAMSQNYQVNPGQYILNPLVPGPLNHLGTKFSKAYNGVVYDVLKNKNSPQLPTGPNVQVDANGGAWNSDMDARYASGQQLSNSIENIRQNNPYQYVLNPFVPGMATELVHNISQTSTGLKRGLLSPFSRSGDTIRRG